MINESTAIKYLLNTFILIGIAYFFSGTSKGWRYSAAYALFFITPVFTYAGLLGPLTHPVIHKSYDSGFALSEG